MDAKPVNDGAVAGAVAVAFAEPPNPIHDVLNTCDITNAVHRDVFINIEGLNSIGAFATMNGDAGVSEMAKRMATRPNVAAGRVILGTLQIKKLQALVFWVKDFDKRGMEAAPELWNDEVMNAAMIRKEAEQNYGNIDVNITDPGKCQTDHDWDNWQLAFVNKLNGTLGAAGSLLIILCAPSGTMTTSSS
jgi:hypothetical protein